MSDKSEAKKSHTKNTRGKIASKKFVGIEHPEYKKLQNKLTEAELKANEYWNGLLRAKADLDNAKKRAEKDIANAHKFALDKFVLELLPVIDSLERGLESCDEEDEIVRNIRQGINLTIELLLKAFNKFGVEQINPFGQKFNPDVHEAMSMREDASVETNTVLEVMQKGYQLNGRLLRPALVIVAKNI